MVLKNFDVNELSFVATRPEKVISAARNYGNEKEMIRAISIMGMWHGYIAEFAIGRWYMGRSRNANTVYASVWFNLYCEPKKDTDRLYVDAVMGGTGRQSGYGLELRGGAMGAALHSAGFTLMSKETNNEIIIDSCSVCAADEAIMSCCVALGYTEKLCSVTHQ